MKLYRCTFPLAIIDCLQSVYERSFLLHLHSGQGVDTMSALAPVAATSADFIETQDDFGQTFKLSSEHVATPTVLEMRLRRIYGSAYGISQASRQQTSQDSVASLIFLRHRQAHTLLRASTFTTN